MIDLNKYINANVEIQLGEDLLHVKIPSVSNMGKIADLEKGLGDDATINYEIKQKTAQLLLNDNSEEKEIPMSVIEQIPLNGLLQVIKAVFSARVELEKDPNSDSQSLKEK
jgi:hypothetical protein